jgi:hypothetical protein
MLKLTNKGKIKRLKKLLWLNFKENFFESIFGTRTYITGLCHLYKSIDHREKHRELFDHVNLNEEIPEIMDFANKKYRLDGRGYWWQYRGFGAWWQRHVAIVRTIWKLKRL